MYISELTIKNYRSFRDFTIELKPLTLIIGENNIGKSNLLDSIGLIFGQDISFFKKRFLEVADFNYDTLLDFKRQVLDFNIPIDSIQFPEIIIEATLKDWNDDQESVISDWYSNAEFSEATISYVFAPVTNFNKQDELQQQRNFITKFKNEITEPEYEKLPESAKLDLINFPISKYHYSIYGGIGKNTQANTYHLNQLRFELLDALRDALYRIGSKS